MTEQLHEHLGRRFNEASYLVGFAHSIILAFESGHPTDEKTLAKFKREYNALFKGSNPEHLVPRTKESGS